MFSDSMREVIDLLLKETLHYSKEPFEYSLEYKKQIIEALTNLYYIKMRLDNPNLAKYKNSKIMFIAKEEAKMRIGQIEDDLNVYSSSSEYNPNARDALLNELNNRINDSHNIANDLRKLNDKLKKLNDRI